MSPHHHIGKIAFKRVSRDILQGKKRTGLNETLDAATYMKENKLKTNAQAMKHLYNK